MRAVARGKQAPKLIKRLLDIREGSVRTTQLFLPDLTLKSVSHLVVAKEEAKRRWGFMDIDGHKLMMLFVVSGTGGEGVGSKLLEYGIAAHAVSEFTVNGRSPQAMGPYEHRGCDPQSPRL